MTIPEQLKIIEMALILNGPLKRQKETSGKLPTAFVQYFGHVAEIIVSVQPEGWPGEEKKFAFNTDRPLNRDYFAVFRTYLDEVQKNALELTKAIQGTNNTTDPL